MAPSNRLKLLNFEIKELKHVHELSNKNGWEKGPQCFSFLDVEHILRISWQTTNQQQCNDLIMSVNPRWLRPHDRDHKTWGLVSWSNAMYISTRFDQFECETNSLERRVHINSRSYNAMETGVINILIPVRKMPCRPFLLTGGISKQNIFFFFT